MPFNNNNKQAFQNDQLTDYIKNVVSVNNYPYMIYEII